jgi:LPXTG-motif cell wall-anchored protein
MALAAGPAVASDTPGATVASTSAVQPEGLINAPDGGGDDQCTKDVCKRINWCDSQGGKIADDAPVVVVTQGGKTPECVQRPAIKKVTCCEDGVGNTIVTVNNPNCIKLRVAVSVDDGTPVIKWIDANGSAEFKFARVANGDHTIRASVWVKKGVWCNFAKVHFKVNCPTPSPSGSHSTSPSPSASVSASPSHSVSHSASPSHSTGAMPPIKNTGNNLPVTGSPVGAIAVSGAALLALGGGALWFGRRRRTRLVIE